MLFAIVLLLAFFLFAWLVFVRFKWLKFNMGWAVVSSFFVAHVLLIFLIGMRFMTPYSYDGRVIQHTIQLIPRLPDPTLVTAVLVEPDVPVKKGQPLFQFDRRPYEYKVQQLEAKLEKAENEIVFTQYQQKLATSLAKQRAGPEEEAQRWDAQLKVNQAGVKEASAELAQARYYLDNTTMVAPEDGRVINLQVRPGMVSGDIRLGAIASFICEEGRYFLANYTQEELKYVTVGMPVELALNLYPGQIFRGHVDAIWNASGTGQLLPSGTLPDFEPAPPNKPQGQYAMKIVFDEADQSKFPIGAQGASAIYTQGMKGAWAAMRRVYIRIYSWMNWLYPKPF